MPVSSPQGAYDFQFRIGAAIADQVAQHLFRLPPIPLSQVNEQLANKPGIYQLFLDEASVYIGQTTDTIFERVGCTHRAKVRGKRDASGRILDDQRVTVRFVLIDDLTVIQISEKPLIDTMTRFALLTAVGASSAQVGSAAAAAAAIAAAGGAMPSLDAINLAPWNSTGFGSNVPGYNRRHQMSAKWAADYPADLTFPVSGGSIDPMPAEALVRQIRLGAPVWFTIPSQKPDRMARAFRTEHVKLLTIPTATRSYLDWLVILEHGGFGIPRVLEPGWRVDRTNPQAHYIVNA